MDNSEPKVIPRSLRPLRLSPPPITPRPSGLTVELAGRITATAIRTPEPGIRKSEKPAIDAKGADRHHDPGQDEPSRKHPANANRITSTMSLSEFHKNRPSLFWCKGDKKEIIAEETKRFHPQAGFPLMWRDTVSTRMSKAVVHAAACRNKQGVEEYLAVKVVLFGAGEVCDKAENEVKILKNLCHNHIIAFVGCYTQGEILGILLFPVAKYNLWIYMEEISVHNGAQTSDSVTQHKNVARLKGYFACLSQAMLYLHKKLIKHGDINPDNILIDGFGNVILTGFGISEEYRSRDEIVTSGFTICTVKYASKETVRGLDRDLDSDIFSLGCVFLEMATVILGETLRDSYEHIGNQTQVIYCEKPEEVQSWVDHLRERLVNDAKGTAAIANPLIGYEEILDTILLMMSEEPKKRPSLTRVWAVFQRLVGRCESCFPPEPTVVLNVSEPEDENCDDQSSPVAFNIPTEFRPETIKDGSDNQDYTAALDVSTTNPLKPLGPEDNGSNAQMPTAVLDISAKSLLETVNNESNSQKSTAPLDVFTMDPLGLEDNNSAPQEPAAALEMPTGTSLEPEDDDSEIVSLVESVWSTTTDGSSVSSVYSAANAPGAREHILALLLRDGELEVLFSLALTKVSAAKFENRFRAMLRQFARELRKEAQDKRQRSVACVVKTFATYVANSIRKAFSDETDAYADQMEQFLDQLPQKRQQLERFLNAESECLRVVGREEGNIDEEQDGEIDEENWNENDVGPVHQVEQFIINSQAMSNLRTRLRNWINPSLQQRDPLEQGQFEVPESREVSEEPEKPEKASVALEPSAEPKAERTMEEVPESPKLLAMPKTVGGALESPGRPVEAGEAEEHLLSTKELEFPKLFMVSPASAAIDWVQPFWRRLSVRLEKFTRPSVATGYRRIEWTCDCGEELFGDYDNGDPVATERLASTLQQRGLKSRKIKEAERLVTNGVLLGILRKESVSGCGPVSDNSGGGGVGSGANPGGSVSGSGPGRSGSNQRNPSNQGAPSGTSNSSSNSQPTPGALSSCINLTCTPEKRRYFELCVNTGEISVNLGEIDITDVDSDGELFKRIYERYKEIRGYRIRRVFLKPVDVHFVHFSVQKRYRVGIYGKPLVIPPEDEVKAERYHYWECPLKPQLPMDHRTFLHYMNTYKHGNTTDPRGITVHRDATFLNRLPKKVGCSIFMNQQSSLEFGWGVHIIEGANKVALSWATFICLALSFVVSLLYCHFWHTQEQGFGIGQWMVAVLAAAMAALYFHWAET